jgi:hypothetical protein
MKHYDKDYRFMAARDLCEAVESQMFLCNGRLQVEIISAFMNQLEDQSLENKGNAVSCLCRLVSHMQEDSVCMSYLSPHPSYNLSSACCNEIVGFVGYRSRGTPGHVLGVYPDSPDRSIPIIFNSRVDDSQDASESRGSSEGPQECNPINARVFGFTLYAALRSGIRPDRRTMGRRVSVDFIHESLGGPSSTSSSDCTLSRLLGGGG